MTESISWPSPAAAQKLTAQSSVAEPEQSDIGKRFEQMLWAEMLMHAGLEEALTKNGGEAASSFSRYVVEAIAEDIAEKHPLGLGAGGQQITRSAVK